MHLSLSSYSWSLHTENPDNYRDFEFRFSLSLSLSLSLSQILCGTPSKVKNRSCATLYGDKKANRYPSSSNPGLPSSFCRFNRSISLIPATASRVRSTAQTCHSSSRAVSEICIREINARCQSWFIFIVLHYTLYYFQLPRVSFYLFVLQDDSGISSLLFPIETTRRWFHLFFSTFQETFSASWNRTDFNIMQFGPCTGAFSHHDYVVSPVFILAYMLTGTKQKWKTR